MKMYAIIEIEGNDEVEILAKAKSIGHIENIADDMGSLVEMANDDMESCDIDWDTVCKQDS
jgi:hypothetical protein